MGHKINNARCYYTPANGNVSHRETCQPVERFTDSCERSNMVSGKFAFRLRSDCWDRQYLTVELLSQCNKDKAMRIARNSFPVKRFNAWLTAMSVSVENQRILKIQLVVALKAKELGFSTY